MGTNYYLERTIRCEHCQQIKEAETLHIGKSSAGWCFSLQSLPEHGLTSLGEWLTLLVDGGVIRDEYGDLIKPSEMIRIIACRRREEKNLRGFNFSQNCAEPGPNNLIRSRLDGNHCVAHGEGTWDLIAGDFS